jgi:uncharacterized coiled-coil DUF342 family protein
LGLNITQRHAMGSDNAELLEEIKRLREELNQMREIVNMLLSVVMDEQEEEEEYGPVFVQDDPGRRLNLYN